MRILFLLLSVMLVSVSAEAQLCIPAWLANASGGEARALIPRGSGRQPEMQHERKPPFASGSSERSG